MRRISIVTFLVFVIAATAWGQDICSKLAYNTWTSGSTAGIGGTINPDGTESEELFSISAGSQVWSADLSKVVFVSADPGDDYYEIFMANSDGTGITQLTDFGDQWGQASPRFRSGSKIWFTRSMGTGHSELHEINYDGTGLRQLSNFYAQGKQMLEFVPFGEKIYYITQNSSWSPTADVFVANILTDGTGQEYVDWNNATRLTNDNYRDRSLDISPDGSKLAFNRATGSGGYNEPFNCMVMNTDGTDLHIVAAGGGGVNYYNAVFSPDGSKLAVNRNNGQSDIVVMNLDGTGMVNITNTPNRNEAATDWREFNCGSTVGTIAGIVSDPSGGLLGVPVTVTDMNSEIIASTATNENGAYEFADITNGDYTVSISTPLGYQTMEDVKNVTVAGGLREVNFDLTAMDIQTDIRTRGYWAYQTYMGLLGITKDYTPDEIAAFAGLIADHFASNAINPVEYYSVPQPATRADSLTALKDMLYMQSTDPTESYKQVKAKAQLLALIMNVVSGKVSQTEPISTDGRTVSQAITYCDMLINNECDVYEVNGAWFEIPYPTYRYAMAGYILTLINNNYPIKTGMIDPNTSVIAYRPFEEASLPTEFDLGDNYPNPFNPTTTIKYSLPEACDVTIVVYNITGQTVKTLVNENESAGEHSVVWDGRDASGQSVASGIYLYKITAGEYTDTKKMQLLK